MNKRLLKPSDFPMAKSLFDDDGIFASNPELRSIALQVMEQEKRERELRREWFSKWNDTRSADGGQWGIWNISDRD
jgi:hypothetical protein